MTEADIIYNTIEQASKSGYNWRGIWNRLSYSSKIHNCEIMANDGSWREYLSSWEFIATLCEGKKIDPADVKVWILQIENAHKLAEITNKQTELTSTQNN